MAEYFPLDQLSQIYLIDLCEPLLQVARQRFAARGLKNVQVLCQDAKEFNMPGLSPGQKVDLFTCSYSISMVSLKSVSLSLLSYPVQQIPPFYAVLDRINDFLDPDTGIFGVVDFYVSDSSGSSGDKSAHIGGDSSRHCGWLSRFFWSHWFSLDHVELHPARRDYLEYRFGTIKCFNGRNNFVLPFIVRM
jgi:betaine lipid synthase